MYRNMQAFKALYDLKQAQRAWYEKIHAYLIAICFQNSPIESTLYVKCKNNVTLVIVLYVDDMLLIRPNEKQTANFKTDLNTLFEMSNLGLLHHYLGIEFKQVDGGIALC